MLESMSTRIVVGLSCDPEYHSVTGSSLGGEMCVRCYVETATVQEFAALVSLPLFAGAKAGLSFLATDSQFTHTHVKPAARLADVRVQQRAEQY